MRLLAAILIVLAIGAIYLTPGPVRISGDDIQPVRAEKVARAPVSGGGVSTITIGPGLTTTGTACTPQQPIVYGTTAATTNAVATCYNGQIVTYAR